MMVALGLGIAGWLGVAYLLSNVHPTLPAKAAFLAVWAIALMGTAWPVLLALHRRFLGRAVALDGLAAERVGGAFGRGGCVAADESSAQHCLGGDRRGCVRGDRNHLEPARSTGGTQ